MSELANAYHSSVLLPSCKGRWQYYDVSFVALSNANGRKGRLTMLEHVIQTEVTDTVIMSVAPVH